MVATDVVTFGEIGFDEKEIGLMILGNYYAIIPLECPHELDRGNREICQDWLFRGAVS